MERKLAAIFCADVAGYSRLMEKNEEATLATLTAHRKIIDSLIAQHRGRFVNSAGDSVLAEFASVVNAVQCGVEIQTALKAENADLSAERRMEFRIGINLGDVIVDGEQIYGDGVNVAARLESLAEPGGICISDIVHAQIRNKLPLDCQDAGQQKVKNIAEPVRVFRVLLEPRTYARAIGNWQERTQWRRGAFSLASIAIIIASILVVQHLSLKPPRTSASNPPQNKPALALPNLPSIAVLPFTNLSGDPGQEYFSDGLTDNLITSLSRLPGVFVIARNSSFFYKGKAIPVQQVGRELGVRTILQGSVLRAAGQVRINAQLADTIDGANIWAQSFDQPSREIFTLQDEVVRQLVMTLNEFFKLRNLNVPAGFRIDPTDNIEAFDYFLRGAEYYWRLTEDGNAKARELFEKAIRLDPKYANAYAFLAGTYSWAVVNQWSEHPEIDLKRADELAQKALALDDSNLGAWGILSRDDAWERRFDQAVADGKRLVALNPNYAMGYLFLGEAQLSDGMPGEAIANLRKASRLDPESQDFYAGDIGFADLFMGRDQEAIPLLEKFAAIYPNHLLTHLGLSVAYTELGKDREAHAQAAEAIRLNPQFKCDPPEKFPNKDPMLAERFCADLRQAGLK
jgi:adenylate cyclase